MILSVIIPIKPLVIAEKAILELELIFTKTRLSVRKTWKYSFDVLRLWLVCNICIQYSLILIIDVKKIISLDSTRSTGFSAIKLTALGRPNLLVSPETH